MPLTRRQIYRRRRTAVFGSLGAVLAAAVYLPLTLLAPLDPATARVQPYEAPVTTAAQLAWPSYGGSAIGAVGFDGVLASTGSTDALPMASITKIVTALVALEAHPLAVGERGPQITMGSGDVALYDKYLAMNGKVLSVRSGLSFSQYELMQIVLIESANNYSESLATWAYGSEAAFLDAARAWLAAHGLGGISIVDSTGISPQNTGSTSDLVVLGRLALENPVIAEIVGTDQVSMHDVGVLDSTNSLLGEEGVTGIKTGTLDDFGSNLLFSTVVAVGESEVTVIGTVLGAASHASLVADIRSLLAGVRAGFQEITLTTAGQSYASYTTAWGDTVRAVTPRSEKLVVWSDTAPTALVSAGRVTLGEEGDQIGSVTFTVGTRTVDVPLELDGEIDDPGPLWRITHPAELF